MDQIENLLREYGAIGVFLGAAFEGQTAVIAGGFLAHLELMPLWLVTASACSGSYLIDQGLFLAGRRFRNNSFVVRTSQTPAFAKALRFFARYPVSYIIAFRFIVGLRLASPIAIGVSDMGTWRFTALNLLSAAIWAGTFSLLGYWFGHTFQAWFGQIKGIEHWLGLGLIGLVIAFAAFHLAKWIWAFLRARRSGQLPSTPPQG
jgi:membrane protein DedA with SNARE-associated domain